MESFGDDRVHFFENERNLGAARNWNRAREKASGEFVGLLNHDDLYGPFWLTFAVKVLEKNPHVGWVGTAHRVVDEEGKTLQTISRFPDMREYSPSESFPVLIDLNGVAPAYIARREALEQADFYDESIGVSADTDLYMRLASIHPLFYSNNPHHAAWRRHADNLIHRWGFVDQVREGLRTLDKIFRDQALPEELSKYKGAAYTYFY